MSGEATERAAFKWLPIIDQDYCMGCGTCVRTCEHRCLEMVWDFSTLTRPQDCVSCGACMTACPNKVIRMDWVQSAGSRKVGRWRDQPYEPESIARRGWPARLFGRHDR